MSFVDWLILLMPVAVVFVISLYARRYITGVADFLAGRRAAGRYLLNPFDTGNMKNFNIISVLIGVASTVYGVMG